MNKRIDALKGIAIVLVVLGHIHGTDTPEKVWNSLRSFLYSFHLPLFFILSGFFMATKMPTIKLVSFRNIVPFISFSIITLSYKWILQIGGHSSEIQHPITWQSFVAHFLNPNGQFATFLWFLYALFIIQIVYLLILNRYSKRWIFAILLILAHWNGWTSMFCIRQVMQNYPFFMAGALLAAEGKKSGKWAIPGILIGVCLYPIAYQTRSWLYLAQFVAAVMPWAVAWWLVWKLDETRMGLWAHLGHFSIGIYLWHTLTNGVIGFVLNHFKMDFWVQTGFVWLSSVGICLLIALYLKRFPTARRILYGRT